MKSSALASTSWSPSAVLALFPRRSLTVAGRRASTIFSSSKCPNGDFKLADFLILAGSFTGISPAVGFVGCRRADCKPRPCSARPPHFLRFSPLGPARNRPSSNLFARKRDGFALTRPSPDLFDRNRDGFALNHPNPDLSARRRNGVEVKAIVPIMILRSTKKTAGVNQLFIDAHIDEEDSTAKTAVFELKPINVSQIY
ncbi:biosynthetic arginine decarboxylase [Striga asiatica]|uniref:Biosynthetic arginine decarboxylase n=1 Tax=Striga asiatica TaxID=4170 RepID=A0A5A7PGU4_STRAF|nr:biosynthetic arginine decarboxylase [Striga asiatica]